MLTVVEDRNDNGKFHVELGDWGDHALDMPASWGRVLADTAIVIEREYDEVLDGGDGKLLAMRSAFNDRIEQEDQTRAIEEMRERRIARARPDDQTNKSINKQTT